MSLLLHCDAAAQASSVSCHVRCNTTVVLFNKMRLVTGILYRLMGSAAQKHKNMGHAVVEPLTSGTCGRQLGCCTQTRMAEVVQTCTLLVTGRLEEVLEPVQRAQKYPAVQLDGLTIVLTKFRFIVFLHAMLLLHLLVPAHADIRVGMMLSVSFLQGDWGQGFFIWASFVWKQQAACGTNGWVSSVTLA